ncbi:predicted protein [Nematostella vectensis]|uniref:Uncharacterized protein n=1 Tax=Nematostella vectensis TaxID=45351 RepID=A7RZR6_NEMVE|nr:predicted protein [Nematostella vectensis]|eukprot:XP_001635100.1 predicted protein [Nematostella vectensis]
MKPGLIALVCLCWSCNVQFVVPQIPEARGTVSLLVQSFERVLDFLEREMSSINLDAVLGLRMAEGLLLNLLRLAPSSGSHIDVLYCVLSFLTFSHFFEGVLLQTLQDPEVQEHHPWVLHRIKGLAHRVSKLIPEILPFLQKSDRVYYQQVGFVVSKTWSVVRRFRKLNKAPKRHLAFNDKKAGTQAPQPCMEALFGSAGPGSKTCNVTDACWTAMRRPGALGYELTHQALYFMFGEERGCIKAFQDRLRLANEPASLRPVYDRICADTFYQMLALERMRGKTQQEVDLYLEMSAVCGLLGYSQFLSFKRMGRLLRWQMPNGCYGDPNYDALLNEAGGVLYQTSHSRATRSLLTVKELEEGCESHITGVATALISVYLRWVLHSPEMTSRSIAQEAMAYITSLHHK